jgi:hypothetical protein
LELTLGHQLIARYRLPISVTLTFFVDVRYMLFAIFTAVKSEPEIVLAVKWRPTAKMTSPFDSLPPISYRRFAEIYHLSLTVHKLLECFDLAEKFGSKFQNMRF